LLHPLDCNSAALGGGTTPLIMLVDWMLVKLAMIGSHPMTLTCLDHWGALCFFEKLDQWYPLVNQQFAIENGHRNSEFTHSKW